MAEVLDFLPEFRSRVTGQPARLAVPVAARAVLRVLPIAFHGAVCTGQNSNIDAAQAPLVCAAASWLLGIGAWKHGAGVLEEVDRGAHFAMLEARGAHTAVTVRPIVDALRAPQAMPARSSDGGLGVLLNLTGAFRQVLGQRRMLLSHTPCEPGSCRDAVQLAYEALLGVSKEFSGYECEYSGSYCAEAADDLRLLDDPDLSKQDWDRHVPVEAQVYLNQVQSRLAQEPLFRGNSSLLAANVACCDALLGQLDNHALDRRLSRLLAASEPVWHWWRAAVKGGAAIDPFVSLFNSAEPQAWTGQESFLGALGKTWKPQDLSE